MLLDAEQEGLQCKKTDHQRDFTAMDLTRFLLPGDCRCPLTSGLSATWYQPSQKHLQTKNHNTLPFLFYFPLIAVVIIPICLTPETWADKFETVTSAGNTNHLASAKEYETNGTIICGNNAGWSVLDVQRCYWLLAQNPVPSGGQDTAISLNIFNPKRQHCSHQGRIFLNHCKLGPSF